MEKLILFFFTLLSLFGLFTTLLTNEAFTAGLSIFFSFMLLFFTLGLFKRV